MTNIGIGAKAEVVRPRKQDRLVGSVIGSGRFLKHSLTEMAVDSEGKVDMMGVFDDQK